MTERVLVVDDTPGARLLMQTLLADKGGYAVIEAASGAEALQYIQVTIPDLIIVDYMMPDMDGPQLLVEIRKIPAAADIPIIMLTARSDARARQESLTAGATLFITKPINLLKLLDKVRELLRQ
jgi:CheY-like chemotaxis protein